MNETPKQYQDRIFRTLGTREPMEVLQETPKVLRNLMERTGRQRWTKPGDSGKWTAAQVLAHYAEGEIVIAYRLRTIARNSGTDIQAYDQNVWVEDSAYLIANPELALQLFESLRRANIAFLQSLPQSALENYGVHSERGKETILDTMRLCAGHDLNHLKQIEQLLS
jgi:hypothetical protein